MQFESPYMTSYMTAIVIFDLSLTVYEICANKIKCQKCDRENERQRQAEEKTALEMSDSIFWLFC